MTTPARARSARRSDPPRREGWRFALRLALVAGAAGALPTNGAWAGPPLIADDPNTIGAGHVQAILHGRVTHRDREGSSTGPAIDLTVGLLEGLDGILTGGYNVDFGSDLDDSRTIGLSPGFKWRPLNRDGWRASFTPAVGIDVDDPDTVGVVAPVQVERDVAPNAVVGLDSGFTWNHQVADTWSTGLYGAWTPADFPQLMAELVLRGDRQLRQVDSVASLGIDWSVAPSFDLLASVGTGIASTGVPRVVVRGYLGLQWSFSLGQ